MHTPLLQVGSTAELRISMRRLGAFLSLPEPPEPWHTQAAAATGIGSTASSDRAAAQSASRYLGRASANAAAAAAAAAAEKQQMGGTLPAVEVAGADFDWANRSWAAAANGAINGDAAGTAGGGGAAVPLEAVNGAVSGGSAFQLRNLQFSVAPGKLVAIVGSVGTGEGC
jgi:hypothetical protein